MSRTSSSQAIARLDSTQEQTACNIITPDNFYKGRDPVPKSLTLRFCKAADLDKVEELFKPENKIQVDPNGYVMSRSRAQLEEQVARGSAAMFVDENDNIRVFCLASDRDRAENEEEHYTEIGAVMTDIRGFKAPQTLISALAIKEQQTRDKAGRIYSKVARNNGASNTVFSKHLSWEKVICTTKSHSLFEQAYPDTSINDPRRLSRTWYHHSMGAALTSTTTLLANALRGHLASKSGTKIPVDLQAMSLFDSPAAMAT